MLKEQFRPTSSNYNKLSFILQGESSGLEMREWAKGNVLLDIFSLISKKWLSLLWRLFRILYNLPRWQWTSMKKGMEKNLVVCAEHTYVPTGPPYTQTTPAPAITLLPRRFQRPQLHSRLARSSSIDILSRNVTWDRRKPSQVALSSLTKLNY